jgi:hypothetical protein
MKIKHMAKLRIFDVMYVCMYSECRVTLKIVGMNIVDIKNGKFQE